MTLDDADEAANVLQVALTALQAAVPTQTGRTAAEFRYACGDILAQASALISTAALGTSLQACFDDAVAAGATLNGLVAVRNAVAALTLTGQAAIYVAGGCYSMALGSEVKILAAFTFTSSNAALGALAVFSAAVDMAQDWAADNHLPALYQNLLTIGAAVSRDLTTRATSLPRLTTYSFPRGTTSHALAYRLYGDAGRCDELRAENGVIAPAFMPASGTALSD